MMRQLGLLTCLLACLEPAAAQTSAWTCTRLAAEGQSAATNTSCPANQQRWDLGGQATLLYAACMVANCTNWNQAVWQRWDTITGQVFACPSRAPGAWSNCGAERWFTKTEVTLATPPPSDPPKVSLTSDKATVTAGEPFVLTWAGINITTCSLSWDPGTVAPGNGMALRTQSAETDYLVSCQGVSPGIFTGAFTIGMTQPPPVVPVPTGNLTATPPAIAAGESSTLQWTVQNASDCDSSWAGPGTPLTGTVTVTPPVTTQYSIGCQGLPGAASSSSWTVTVAVVGGWVKPPTPKCWPVDFSKVSALRGIASGDLRQLLSSFGVQELVSTDGAVSAFGYGCDLADGYSFPWFVVRHSGGTCWRQVSYRTVLTAAFWSAVWDTCSVEHTPLERKLGADLRAAYSSKFVVQSSGTLTSRPVYAQNTNGTRGARVTIGGVAQSIAVATPCDGRRRLTGTTTRYCEVSGLLSVTGIVLPASSFAAATKQDPPPTGWP